MLFASGVIVSGCGDECSASSAANEDVILLTVMDCRINVVRVGGPLAEPSFTWGDVFEQPRPPEKASSFAFESRVRVEVISRYKETLEAETWLFDRALLNATITDEHGNGWRWGLRNVLVYPARDRADEPAISIVPRKSTVELVRIDRPLIPLEPSDNVNARASGFGGPLPPPPPARLDFCIDHTETTPSGRDVRVVGRFVFEP